MRSSIFNSRLRLIPAALAAFVAVTALYAWAAEAWFPGGVPSAYQRRANAISVEKWLHGDGDWPVVLVGSSMGAVLVAPDLPAGSYNLALSSFGARTGLEIVLRSQRRPRVVLVEANVTALSPVDHDLIASAFEPATFRLQQWLPVARHDHQPIALLDESLRRWAEGSKRASDYVMPAALFGQRLADLAAQQDGWTAAGSGEALEQLARLVRELHDRGIRVVFFEPPMDPRLKDTPQTAGVRRLLRTRFADAGEWIAAADWSRYRTSDGLHLTPESATRYARFLAEQLAAR